MFGLPGTKPLSKKVDETADAVRTERAVGRQRRRARLRRDAPQGRLVAQGAARRRPHRGHAARPRHPLHRHQSRPRLGRMALRNLYCARGQAENLIKLHKAQLASDRTSCRSALANQVRLVLHTAAYWLMLAVRDAIPESARSGQSRVRDIAPEAAQDRRPRHRNGEPRPSGLRRRLSRGRALRLRYPPRSCRADPERRGAKAPLALPFPPTRSKVPVSMR